MDDHINKRHNKTLLLYHIVFPVKYRNSVITDEAYLKVKDYINNLQIKTT